MCCADWLLHEQVAVAAMDVHAISAAHKLVTAVVNKYPKSARAARLKVRLTHALTGSATHSAAAGSTTPLVCLKPASDNLAHQAQHYTRCLCMKQIIGEDLHKWSEAPTDGCMRLACSQCTMRPRGSSHRPLTCTGCCWRTTPKTSRLSSARWATWARCLYSLVLLGVQSKSSRLSSTRCTDPARQQRCTSAAGDGDSCGRHCCGSGSPVTVYGVGSAACTVAGFIADRSTASCLGEGPTAQC